MRVGHVGNSCDLDDFPILKINAFGIVIVIAKFISKSATFFEQHVSQTMGRFVVCVIECYICG